MPRRIQTFGFRCICAELTDKAPVSERSRKYDCMPRWFPSNRKRGMREGRQKVCWRGGLARRPQWVYCQCLSFPFWRCPLEQESNKRFREILLADLRDSSDASKVGRLGKKQAQGTQD